MILILHTIGTVIAIGLFIGSAIFTIKAFVEIVFGDKINDK